VASIKFGRHRVGLPRRRLHRRVLGGAFVAGGLVGFLPVVGFWMIPVGLLVLSVDSAPIRRFRRRHTVGMGSWLKQRYPGLAEKVGFSINGKPRRGN